MRYSPRNGTIRGPASPSTCRASRSPCSPAHTTSRSKRCGRSDVVTSTASPADRIRETSVPSRIRPPAASMSAANRWATATKSVIAVAGECSAESPAACGSTSRSPAASSRRSPGTPFSVAVCSSASSRGSSSASTATTSLPTSSYGSAVLGAVVAQQQPAARAQLGLEAAGSVVDPGVDDAGVVAGLVCGEPVLLLEDHDPGAGPAAAELAADREAEDAPADDADRRVAHWSRSPQTSWIGCFGSFLTLRRRLRPLRDHRPHLLELAEAQQPVLGLEHVARTAGWRSPGRRGAA